MADNVTTQSTTPATPPASTVIATVEASWSGDSAQAGVGVLAKSSGAEGARTLTLINPATEDKQDAEATLIGAVTETAPSTDTASSGLNGRLQRIAQRLTSLIVAIGSPFQAGGSIGNTSFGSTNFPTTVDTNSGSKSASTLRVVLATDQPTLSNAQPVSQSGTWNYGRTAASAETLSNVAASVTSVTALASNASRVGAIFFNDSTSAAYLKLGSSATTSSFTYKLQPYQTLELPVPVYTGIVTALWDSGTGNLRVTETT